MQGVADNLLSSHLPRILPSRNSSPRSIRYPCSHRGHVVDKRLCGSISMHSGAGGMGVELCGEEKLFGYTYILLCCQQCEYRDRYPAGLRADAAILGHEFGKEGEGGCVWNFRFGGIVGCSLFFCYSEDLNWMLC